MSAESNLRNELLQLAKEALSNDVTIKEDNEEKLLGKLQNVKTLDKLADDSLESLLSALDEL